MKLIPMPSLFRKTQEKILNKKITIGDMDLDPRLMKAIQKLPIDSNGLPLYIHIGKDFIINSKYIIAIFNIDYVKNTKEYKAMYKSLEEAGNIVVVSDKKEMSFILTEENNIKEATKQSILIIFHLKLMYHHQVRGATFY